jgi:hypothetical protein
LTIFANHSPRPSRQPDSRTLLPDCGGIFGFEEIESYSDIPAFDIAILVERQVRKHEHMDNFH